MENKIYPIQYQQKISINNNHCILDGHKRQVQKIKQPISSSKQYPDNVWRFKNNSFIRRISPSCSQYLIMHNKVLIFILTSWSYGALEGTASAFSMTKEPMSQELSLTETYLGLVDSVTIIGTIIGTFLMISLTTHIKRNFLIFSIIHSIFFAMLTISPLIPAKAGQVIILICMFIVGVAKASIVFPQILFSNFFHSGQQKFYFNLWYGLTFLGDTCGILISKAIISMLKLGWEINIYFFCFILCLSTFLIYFLIEDPTINTQIDQQPQSVSQIITNIKQFLKPSTNKLITADFALQEVLYNNIILWMPYSFQMNDLKGQDYIATLAFPITIAMGALFIQYPVSFCESQSKYVLNFMILLACGAFLAMWILDLTQELVLIHIILLAASGFIMGAPYSRVCSGDPAEVCEGDPKKIHTAFFTINFVRYISSAFALFLVGYLLQKDEDALQKVNFINIFLVLIVSIIRRFFFPPQLSQKGQELEQKQDQPPIS